MGTLSWLVCSCALLGGTPNGMLLNFSSPQCGPCRSISPLISQLEREGLPIRRVDTSREPALAQYYGITSIPAFVLIIDGKRVTSLVGVQSEQTLRGLLAQIPMLADPVAVATANNASNAAANGVRTANASGSGSPRTFASDSSAASDRRRGSNPTSHAAASSNPHDFNSPLAAPAPKRKEGSREAGRASQAVAQDGANRRGGHTVPASSLGDPVASASPAPAKSGFKLPFLNRQKNGKEAAGPIVRGQANENSSSDSGQRNPLKSTVRIRVVTPQGENLGTGTIIDSQVGRSIVLTCGHLFRDIPANTKITVDVFESEDGEVYETLPARLVKFDLDADCGLLSLSAEGLPVTPVAGLQTRLIKGMPVQSFGCGGGERPTIHQMRLTALNRYLGPDNLECDDVPVQGRSGGGLFTRDGWLIGICTAADNKEQRGLYCGLKPIQKLLDQCQLTSLYVPKESSAAALASVSDSRDAGSSNRHQPEDDEAADLEADLSAAGAPVASVASGRAGRGTPLHESAELKEVLDQVGPAEVVCVIRPIDKPRDASRVVVIHRASPKFLSYLGDEADDQAQVQPTMLQSPAADEPGREPNRDADASIARLDPEDTPRLRPQANLVYSGHPTSSAASRNADRNRTEQADIDSENEDRPRPYRRRTTTARGN